LGLGNLRLIRLSIKSLAESPGVFERNKILLELRVLSLAFYVQLSSLRRAVRALSEIHRELSEKISIKQCRMRRRLIALDETCVKVKAEK
jgi:hypothetical protein